MEREGSGQRLSRAEAIQFDKAWGDIDTLEFQTQRGGRFQANLDGGAIPLAEENYYRAVDPTLMDSASGFPKALAQGTARVVSDVWSYGPQLLSATGAMPDSWARSSELAGSALEMASSSAIPMSAGESESLGGKVGNFIPGTAIPMGLAAAATATTPLTGPLGIAAGVGLAGLVGGSQMGEAARERLVDAGLHRDDAAAYSSLVAIPGAAIEAAGLGTAGRAVERLGARFGSQAISRAGSHLGARSIENVLTGAVGRAGGATDSRMLGGAISAFEEGGEEAGQGSLEEAVVAPFEKDWSLGGALGRVGEQALGGAAAGLGLGAAIGGKGPHHQAAARAAANSQRSQAQSQQAQSELDQMDAKIGGLDPVQRAELRTVAQAKAGQEPYWKNVLDRLDAREAAEASQVETEGAVREMREIDLATRPPLTTEKAPARWQELRAEFDAFYQPESEWAPRPQFIEPSAEELMGQSQEIESTIDALEASDPGGAQLFRARAVEVALDSQQEPSERLMAELIVGSFMRRDAARLEAAKVQAAQEMLDQVGTNERAVMLADLKSRLPSKIKEAPGEAMQIAQEALENIQRAQAGEDLDPGELDFAQQVLNIPIDEQSTLQDWYTGTQQVDETALEAEAMNEAGRAGLKPGDEVRVSTDAGRHLLPYRNKKAQVVKIKPDGTFIIMLPDGKLHGAPGKSLIRAQDWVSPFDSAEGKLTPEEEDALIEQMVEGATTGESQFRVKDSEHPKQPGTPLSQVRSAASEGDFHTSTDKPFDEDVDPVGTRAWIDPEAQQALSAPVPVEALSPAERAKRPLTARLDEVARLHASSISLQSVRPSSSSGAGSAASQSPTTANSSGPATSSAQPTTPPPSEASGPAPTNPTPKTKSPPPFLRYSTTGPSGATTVSADPAVQPAKTDDAGFEQLSDDEVAGAREQAQEAWERSGDNVAEAVAPGELSGVLGGMGGAIVGGLRDAIWKRVQAGKLTELPGGPRSELMVAAQEAVASGAVTDRASLDAWWERRNRALLEKPLDPGLSARLASAAARTAERATAAAKREADKTSRAKLKRDLGDQAPALPNSLATKADYEKIAQAIRDVIRKVTGRHSDQVLVNFPKQIVEDGMTAHGRIVGQVIDVALNPSSTRMYSAGFHEAFHWVMDNVLTASERSIVTNAALANAPKAVGRMSDTARQEWAEERAADMFAEHVLATMGDPLAKPATGKLRELYEKLRQFFLQLRNKLHAMEFRSAEEIFSRAIAGDIAAIRDMVDHNIEARLQAELAPGAVVNVALGRDPGHPSAFWGAVTIKSIESAGDKTMVSYERVRRGDGLPVTERKSLEAFRRAAGSYEYYRGKQDPPAGNLAPSAVGPTFGDSERVKQLETKLRALGFSPKATPAMGSTSTPPTPPGRTEESDSAWLFEPSTPRAPKWWWNLAPMAWAVGRLGGRGSSLAKWGHWLEQYRDWLSAQAAQAIQDGMVSDRKRTGKRTTRKGSERFFGMIVEKLDIDRRITEARTQVRDASNPHSRRDRQRLLDFLIEAKSALEAEFGPGFNPATADYEADSFHVRDMVAAYRKWDDTAYAQFRQVALDHAAGRIEDHFPHRLSGHARRSFQAQDSAFNDTVAAILDRVITVEGLDPKKPEDKARIQDTETKVRETLAGGAMPGNPFDPLLRRRMGNFELHRSELYEEHLRDHSIGIVGDYFQRAATATAEYSYFARPAKPPAGAAGPTKLAWDAHEGMKREMQRISSESGPRGEELANLFLRSMTRAPELQVSERWWHQIASGLAQWNYLTKLLNPVTWITNLTQILTVGVSRGPVNTGRALGQVMFTQSGRDRARRAGSVAGGRVSGIFIEPLEAHTLGGAILNSVTSKLVSGTFGRTEAFNNMVAGMAGLHHVHDLIDAIRSPSWVRTVLNLGELRQGEARRILETQYKLEPSDIDAWVSGGLSAQRLSELEDQAIYYGATNVNFRTSAIFMPRVFVGNGMPRFLATFKGFAYSILRAQYELALKPIRHGNLKPALAMLIGMGLSGEALYMLLAGLGRDKERKSDYKKDPAWRAAQRFAENYLSSGMAGILARPGDFLSVQGIAGVNFRTLDNSKDFIAAIGRSGFDKTELASAIHQWGKSEIAAWRLAAQYWQEMEPTREEIHRARTLGRFYRDHVMSKSSAVEKFLELDKKEFGEPALRGHRDAVIRALDSGDLAEAQPLYADWVEALAKKRDLEGPDGLKQAARAARQSLMTWAPLGAVSTVQSGLKEDDQKLVDFEAWVDANQRPGVSIQAGRALEVHAAYAEAVKALASAYGTDSDGRTSDKRPERPKRKAAPPVTRPKARPTP